MAAEDRHRPPARRRHHEPHDLRARPARRARRARGRDRARGGRRLLRVRPAAEPRRRADRARPANRGVRAPAAPLAPLPRHALEGRPRHARHRRRERDRRALLRLPRSDRLRRPAARGNGRGQLPARPVARARDVRGHAAACVRHLPLPPPDQGAGTATARRGGRDRVDRDRGALGDAGREGVRLRGLRVRPRRAPERAAPADRDRRRARGGALLGARRRARRSRRGARARLRRLPRHLGRADGGQPRRVRDLRVAQAYKPLRELARQSAKVSRAAAPRRPNRRAARDGRRARATGPGAYSRPRADGAVELDACRSPTPGARGAARRLALVEPGSRIALVGRVRRGQVDARRARRALLRPAHGRRP